MKKPCILLVILLMFSVNSYSQEDPPVGFEGNVRGDLIGVHNHDDKNYALFHGEADFAASISSDNLKLFKGGECNS